jgi:hypothetical protein
MSHPSWLRFTRRLLELILGTKSLQVPEKVIFAGQWQKAPLAGWLR